MTACTWIKPYDLNLTQIKRDSNGQIIAGWVENGCWYFEIKNGEVLCRDYEGGRIVNRFPHRATITEVSAPKYMHHQLSHEEF